MFRLLIILLIAAQIQGQIFRDPLAWPFSRFSIWNMPIHQNAEYVDAGITANSKTGYITQFVPDQDIIVIRPEAVMTPVFYNSVGWDGGDRCEKEGNLIDSVPVPTDYIVPNSGENNSAAFLMPDNETIKQNQPFTRCTAGDYATTLVKTNSVSIYGDGYYGSHGGSGLSAIGGTIRLGEFTKGIIQHAMKINLYAKDYYYCCEPVWPAINVDGYADSLTYGGTNQYLKMGALLALRPSFDTTALATTPAKIIAKAFMEYGAYIADDTYWNAWAIMTEQGPDGNVVDEFKNLFGYSISTGDNDTNSNSFINDVKSIFQNLAIIINNSQETIGGGDTYDSLNRLTELAPPFEEVNISSTKHNKNKLFILNSDSKHLKISAVENTPGNLQIFNLQGKLIKKTDFNKEETIVDIKNLPSGLYFIMIKSSGSGYSNNSLFNFTYKQVH